MHFTSDNIVGASPKVLDAIVRANHGPLPSYGADRLTRDVEAAVSALFERDCATFLVTTGTAANALAASAIVPPYAALLCGEEAHVIDDECGAPEFFTGGSKIVGLPMPGGKLTPDAVRAHLDNEPGGTNHPPFRGLSISQASECGTVYTPAEIAGLADVAHAAGMRLHMDGARFFNALVTLGCTAAEMTWKAGVDVLSLGGTKNGCLMAEAVVFFDAGLATDFQYRRKRAGQTLSKHRLIGAQFQALLDGEHWRGLATHANAMARRLSQGLAATEGIRLAWPTEANEVFAIMPSTQADAMRKAGAGFYEWTARSLDPTNRLQPGEAVQRFVCSFATTAQEVEQFITLARSGSIQAA